MRRHLTRHKRHSDEHLDTAGLQQFSFIADATQSNQSMRPTFTPQHAAVVAEREFGVKPVRVSALDSYDDQNFLLHMELAEGGDTPRFVLKVSNPDFATSGLDMQNQAMLRCQDHGLPVPQVQACTAAADEGVARFICRCEDGSSGTAFDVRLVTYLPGTLLAKAEQSPALLQDLGEVVARADSVLESFSHEAGGRDLDWDLANFRRAHQYLDLVTSAEQRALAQHFIGMYDAVAAPVLHMLPRSIIHNDFNDYNIVVDADTARVTGVFDFGDMVLTHTINDIAICAAYCVLSKDDPLAAASQIVAGFHGTRPLSPLEFDVVFVLITARLTHSVLMSSNSRRLEPDNEYLSVTEGPAWQALQQLRAMEPYEAANVFRGACGLPPRSRAQKLEATLLRSQETGQVILLKSANGSEVPLADAAITVLDFSKAARWQPEVLDDTRVFEHTINSMYPTDSTTAVCGWGKVFCHRHACCSPRVFHAYC
jgi:Ser/Thr protein kinase RdoA (MazF antagonist)